METKKELERKMEKARKRHNAERSALSKMRMHYCNSIFSGLDWRTQLNKAARWDKLRKEDK